MDDALVEKSREVLLGCCLKNGAIIAADSDRPDYPHDVQSYRYVWPRDAAYICYALDLLGMKDEQAKFFRWLKRAEDFERTGLLFQNYHTNGRKRWTGFQPDQNGTILWALYNFIKRNPGYKKEFISLVKLLADGICRVWKKEHFSVITQDIWEERYTYPEMKNNHTYSIAACATGLKCANAISSNRSWMKVSKQMESMVKGSYHEFLFVRRNGLNIDFRPDISILGLIWPFGILKADDIRIINTVDNLHKVLEEKGTFHRYQYDDYDSFRFQGTDAFRGAGTWPIANFWISIYYSIRGDKERATQYIKNVVDRLDRNKNIPEQLFTNKTQVSVKPLAWSHAMYIIARAHLSK